eukprot:gene2861-3555_t
MTSSYKIVQKGTLDTSSGITVSSQPPLTINSPNPFTFEINSTLTNVELDLSITTGNHSISLTIKDSTPTEFTLNDVTYINCELMPSLQIIFPITSRTGLSSLQNVLYKGIPFFLPNLNRLVTPQMVSVSCPASITCTLNYPYFSPREALMVNFIPNIPAPDESPLIGSSTTFSIVDLVNNQWHNFTLGSFFNPIVPSTRLSTVFYPPTQTTITPKVFNHPTIAMFVNYQNLQSLISITTSKSYTIDVNLVSPIYGAPNNMTLYIPLSLDNWVSHMEFLALYNEHDGTSNEMDLIYNITVNPQQFSATFTNTSHNFTEILGYTQFIDCQYSIGSLVLSDLIPPQISHNGLKYERIIYPYGLGKGSAQNYSFSSSLLVSPYTDKSISQDLFFAGVIDKYIFPVYTGGDFNSPILLDIQFIEFNRTHFITRIHATDDLSGINYISLSNQDDIIDSRHLVTGNSLNGYYEKIMKYVPLNFFPFPNVQLFDNSGNSVTVYEFIDSKKMKPIPYIPLSKYLEYPLTENNITQFKFKLNDIDVSNSDPVENQLEVKLLSNEFIFEPVLSIHYSGFDKYFIGQFNSASSSYTIPFQLLPRLFEASLNYTLSFGIVNFNPNFLVNAVGKDAQLRVKSNIVDQMGPIIVNISPFPSVSIQSPNTEFGWEFTIEDYPNGFDWGELSVESNLDYEPFKFKFSVANRTAGDTNSGVYRVSITNLLIEPCRTQEFKIQEVVLRDSLGYVSARYKYQNTMTVDPLYRIDASKLSIFTQCSSGHINSPPELLQFDFNPKSIRSDSLLDSDRTVEFSFIANATQDKLSTRHLPVVYLTYGNLKTPTISQSSTIKVISQDEVQIEYGCKIIIPFRESLDKPILVSVYGFVDRLLYFSGYSSTDLKSKSFSSVIASSYSLDQPLIRSTSKIYNDENWLTILGYNFEVQSKEHILEVDYRDNNGFKNIPIKNRSYGFVITDSVIPTNKPFDIRITIVLPTDERLVSNIHQVIPTIRPTPSPTPSSTPSPTPTQTPTQSPDPSKCKGSPLCGGPSQGRCNEYIGCICLKPWEGFDCNSQIINTTQPNLNNTSPGSNVDGNDFSALVSMVSLRELGVVNNQPIKTHTFTLWNMTKATDDLKINYRYVTKISHQIQDKTFETNVTSVENVALDESGKTISSQEAQSLIGINVRHYKEYVFLDPDFSTIVDFTPEDRSKSTCFSKSGMTKARLAGIIIGSVLGGAVIISMLTYLVIQKHKNQKEMRTIQNRLSSMNTK